jgi:hypothetical protein
VEDKEEEVHMRVNVSLSVCVYIGGPIPARIHPRQSAVRGRLTGQAQTEDAQGRSRGKAEGEKTQARSLLPLYYVSFASVIGLF